MKIGNGVPGGIGIPMKDCYEREAETRLSAIYHDNKSSRGNNPHNSKAFRYLISLFR